jgi:UDP-sulfoquinovose synthase
MRVLILGGDGFCGWPTSLHLSAQGHDVTICDSLARRKIDVELETASLTPIATTSQRLLAWQEVSGRRIDFIPLDVAKDYERLVAVLSGMKPDAVVHFAEQRAAPYSMKSEWHKRYTVENNISATHNLLCAILESRLDIHVVHLGTMGVYGYGTEGSVIPEGYLLVHVDVEGQLEPREILHPTNPGSVYHLTKTMDQLLFAYYNKNDKIRITDLHQGIVWGTNTAQTKLDERLVNRFDYDGDFGTVLNRFLMQAAIGHPLTVYGTGGQTRAFIHIRDTVRCIELAIVHPPEAGERVRIFNQMTETHRVRDLAELISHKIGVPVQFLDNPRNEAEQNNLSVANDYLIKLGLQPTKLDDGLLEEVMDVARRFVANCDRSKILATSKWVRRDDTTDAAGLPGPIGSPREIMAPGELRKSRLNT